MLRNRIASLVGLLISIGSGTAYALYYPQAIQNQYPQAVMSSSGSRYMQTAKSMFASAAQQRKRAKQRDCTALLEKWHRQMHTQCCPQPKNNNAPIEGQASSNSTGVSKSPFNFLMMTSSPASSTTSINADVHHSAHATHPHPNPDLVDSHHTDLLAQESAEEAAVLGTLDPNAIHDLVIIGSGPAGQTAAIYAARANMRLVIFEGFMAGGVPAGGQLTTTTDVENFPGFPHGILGPELMTAMQEQARRFGAVALQENIEAVDLGQRPFVLYRQADRSDPAPIRARALVISTGATAKRLEIPGAGDGQYWQRGVSACAVCDGALPIFRNRPVFVIGGGDTAMEEASFLTKYASIVYVVPGEMPSVPLVSCRSVCWGIRV